MTETSTTKGATARLVASVVIFGTLGLFVRHIPLSSEALAMMRGLLGAGFILIYLRLSGRSLSLPRDRKTRIILVLSGVCLAFNWSFLFKAYGLTTLATAELAYEMAPVIVMAVSPVLLSERLSRSRVLCMAVALVGIVAVSGVLDPGATVGVTPEGVGLGLIAACFFASVMVLNQFLGDVDPLSKTVVQLGIAGLVMAPQVALAGDAGFGALDLNGWLLLGIVGLVHTGVAFILWFSSLHELPAQKVAIFNYIDPAVALLSSTLILGEHMTPLACLGAVLILGSTLTSELLEMRG